MKTLRNNMPERRARRTDAGFSLAELMVVVVIIGLLATMVVPAVMKRLSIATGTTARVDIMTLSSALDEVAILNGGRYPDSLEALVTPDENGYTMIRASKLPNDPWGMPYMYDPPMSGQPFRVYSYGKDGMPGGEGDDADLSNLDED